VCYRWMGVEGVGVLEMHGTEDMVVEEGAVVVCGRCNCRCKVGSSARDKQFEACQENEW
jgi:hypothetical protein